jgi:hypothetical protein
VIRVEMVEHDLLKKFGFNVTKFLSVKGFKDLLVIAADFEEGCRYSLK